MPETTQLQEVMALLVHEFILWAGVYLGPRSNKKTLVVMNPPADAGAARDAHLILGLEDPPGGGWQWQPSPVFLPRESQGQRSLVGSFCGKSQLGFRDHLSLLGYCQGGESHAVSCVGS